MFKIKILAIIFIFSIRVGEAQKISYAEAEKKSYSLFLQGKTDSLIIFANKVLKSGLDYYYLRLRLAEAYMTKGKYRLAIKHLRKALEMNSYEDVFAVGLLYRAYILTGQYVKANNLKKIIALSDSKVIDALFLLYGKNKAGKVPVNVNNDDQRILMGTTNYDVATYMYKGKRLWTITAGISSADERIYYKNKDGTTEYKTYSSKMTNISFDKTIDCGGAFLFSFGFNPVFVSSYNLVEATSLSYRPSFMQEDNSDYYLIKVREFVGNFAAGIEISQSIVDFKLTSVLSYSTGPLYSGFATLNGNIRFYPFYNNKFHIGAKAATIFSFKESSHKEIFSVFSGIYTRHLGLEAFYYLPTDEMNYWYENPGVFYLSNFSILSVGGANIIIPFSKKVTFSAGLLFVNYETESIGGNLGLTIKF
jgi:hypothetical protein